MAPLSRLPCRLHERIKAGICTSGTDPAQSDNGPECTSLQLRCAFQVLLHSILRDRSSFHALLQQWRDFVQTLSCRCRSDLGEAEQHHMTDHLHFVRIVSESYKNASEEFVEIQFRQTRIQLYHRTRKHKRVCFNYDSLITYQCIECLVGCFARFETIVDFVRPRTHLYGTDQIWIYNCLLVKIREDDR